MKKNLFSLLIPNSKILAHLLLIIGLLFLFQSSAFAQEATSEKSSPITKEAKVWHISVHRSIGLLQNFKTQPYIENPLYTYVSSSGSCWGYDFKYFFNKKIGLGFKNMIYIYNDVIKRDFSPTKGETNLDYLIIFVSPELSLKQPLGSKLHAYGDIALGHGIFEDYNETDLFVGYSLNAGLDYFIIRDIALSLQVGFFGIVQPNTQVLPYQSNISSLSLGLKITP